jgi:hypothetical protein
MMFYRVNVVELVSYVIGTKGNEEIEVVKSVV